MIQFKCVFCGADIVELHAELDQPWRMRCRNGHKYRDVSASLLKSDVPSCGGLTRSEFVERLLAEVGA